ncbi:SAM-dependent methyltransferase [Natrinema ejinorense]|uniref:FkbM family methyltransferase n=1 Tax=Natrinema ejinorense TaxID=373386 RepID=A0A2A5QRG1_9EURY|nr:class I SAM-dependent methyltransferase [Natrinema ejinorense]PCR89426.1 hypothetical protein CP557_02070 [Natrinema ejinorense]
MGDSTKNPNHADGVYGIVQQAYNKVLRPRLPRTIGTLAGVEARAPRLLDVNKDRPGYKRGMVDAIRAHVEPGMIVDEIGTGRGVLTVHCLREGASHVRGYEAAEEMLEIAQETLTRNVGPSWSVDVGLHHAIVGEPGNVYGEAAETVVPAHDLSCADVLIMDVEGAEQPILRELGVAPETVIVETHPERGAPPSETRELLEDIGYEIDRRQYEPGVDIEVKPVLVGSLEGHDD